MAIEVTDLTALDADDVQSELDELIERIAEADPDIDVKRGVFHDLVLYYHAVLSAGEQVTLDRYLQARSLAAIEADPTLADAGVVDDVLSNYRLTRQDGSSATGSVMIVLSANNSVTISSGAVLEADGKQFTADSVFTAKAESAQIQVATDRLLTL